MDVIFALRDRDDGRIVLDAASCPKDLGEKRTLVFEGCTEAEFFDCPNDFTLWEKGKAFKILRSSPKDQFGVEVDGWLHLDKGFEITGVYKTFKELQEFDNE